MSGGTGQGGSRPGAVSQGRNIAPAAPAAGRHRPVDASAAATPSDAAPQPDNQPMNEVLRQLFNR